MGLCFHGWLECDFCGYPEEPADPRCPACGGELSNDRCRRCQRQGFVALQLELA